MSDVYEHVFTAMGTVVSIRVVGHGDDEGEQLERREAVARAADWFRHISDACTRFDEESELMRLAHRAGTPVPVSTLLFEAVRFALAVAEESGGAFDPTVGVAMEARGYDREYRTGRTVQTEIAADPAVSFRDVRVDEETHTITLERPLVLDLGAVAKGLGIDMAALELRPFENFAIDAGGDLYLAGHNAAGEEWSVGIRNPRDTSSLIRTLRVSDRAVCTSGDYERGAHIVDPRSGSSAGELASVTVVAPSAMVADALATAAFVLGPEKGIAFLERQGVDGLLVTADLDQHTTSGMPREN